MKQFDGYFKKDIDNNVLLSKGGNKALSDFIGSLYFDSETNTLQYKSATDTTYTDLFQLGARAFDSTEYLPLSGGTINSDSYSIILNGLSNNFSGLALYYNNSLTTELAWRSYGSYIYNHASHKQLGVLENGTPYYGEHNGTQYTLIHSGNISSYLGQTLNARYVTGDSNASSPQGSLLRSGTGRPDASPSGDTWIFYDDCGSYSAPWGIRANQYANTIGFVGAGSEYASINLSNGYYSGTVSWSNILSKPNIISTQYDSTLHVRFNGSGNWNEGIRLHTNNEWNTICMCGSDNTGDTGTSARTWSIHNYYGNLYITLNGSSSGTNYLAAGSSGWTFSSAVYSNSDKRLKKDIQLLNKEELSDLFDASQDLFKKFTWKSNDITSYGFIAQEIQKYIPEAVSVNPGSQYLTVSYDVAYAKIIASLIYKIKELEKEIIEIKNGKVFN